MTADTSTTESHVQVLQNILTQAMQHRNGADQYSPRLQEKYVKDLVELVPHLPEHAEQIIQAATNISDDLCHKGHYGNAFRTAGHIFGKLDALPNTGMLCAKATQTLINSAMDAGEYQTAFLGIYKFMTIGVAKKIPEMFDFGANAMKAALDDCAQNPNSPKLKAAKSAADMVARDNHDYSYLWTIARIAEQQSQPAFAIECYADIAEFYIQDDTYAKKRVAPLKVAEELFLNPTKTCNIYADPNIESAVKKLAPLCPPQLMHSIRDALRDNSYNALALYIANLPVDDDLLLEVNPRQIFVQKIADLASEALPQLQREMEEHKYLSPESIKLCIVVAHSCGLILQVQQKFPPFPLDAKGLDVAPYQALDMLFDSRPEGKIDLLSIATAASAYPVNDAYAKNIHELCSGIRPKNSSGDYILDTTTPAFKDVLINYADKFYDEAATESMLRDFNCATRPLILTPESYRSLGPGIRQRKERPLLKLAV